MSNTVSITLGANTTGAINAIRNFTSAVSPAITGVQKLASGLSNLGSNAASVANLLGNTAMGDAIAKWTDLGTSIAFAGKALVDIGKGATSLLAKTGVRGGLWGLAASLGAYAGLQMFEEAEANKANQDALNTQKEILENLNKEFEKSIKLRLEAGAIDARQYNEHKAQFASIYNGDLAFGKKVKGLTGVFGSATEGIGAREALKAELQANSLYLAANTTGKNRVGDLEDRKRILKSLMGGYASQQEFDQGDGVSVLKVPTSKASEQELKEFKEFLELKKEQKEVEREIARIKEEGSLFLNDLASTAAGSVQTALSGLADGIVGLIQGTRNWAQVWQQTTASILSMVFQLILKFTVLYGLVTALQFLFPGSGFVSKFAGFAGFPGKATGGLIGSGVYQVGERGPEYVINNSTLARLGSGFFDALQSGYSPRIASVPQVGGSASGSAPGNPGNIGVNLAVLGGPGAVSQWAQTREGRSYVVDIVDQRIRDARS